MPNGDEGRAEFERLQRAKEADQQKQAYADKLENISRTTGITGEVGAVPASIGREKPTNEALDKAHADDAAQSAEDAKRFTEEQKKWAMRQATDYLEKMRAAHAAGVITPRQHSRGPLRTLPDLAGSKKKTYEPNPRHDLDMVEDEGADFEYECRDGKNLDELAEVLATSDMLSDIGGLKRSTDVPDYGMDIPWGDPDTWPAPPTELPNVLSDEDQEKLKDTIEQMGQGGDGGGFRMNAGKNQIELLPEIWLWAVADVMTQGARKYPARNWEQGMDWSSMIGCMYRHMAKYQSGQRYDGKEFNKKLGTTGCHELAMVAWNALALMFYDIYGLGNNDLPVYDSLDHFVRVNGSSSDLAVRWAKEDSDV